MIHVFQTPIANDTTQCLVGMTDRSCIDLLNDDFYKNGFLQIHRLCTTISACLRDDVAKDAMHARLSNAHTLAASRVPTRWEDLTNICFASHLANLGLSRNSGMSLAINLSHDHIGKDLVKVVTLFDMAKRENDNLVAVVSKDVKPVRDETFLISYTPARIANERSLYATSVDTTVSSLCYVLSKISPVIDITYETKRKDLLRCVSLGSLHRLKTSEKLKVIAAFKTRLSECFASLRNLTSFDTRFNLSRTISYD